MVSQDEGACGLKGIFGEEHAQAAVEYLLLVGVAVVMVVLAVTLLRNSIFSPTADNAAKNASSIRKIINELNATR